MCDYFCLNSIDTDINKTGVDTNQEATNDTFETAEAWPKYCCIDKERSTRLLESHGFCFWVRLRQSQEHACIVTGYDLYNNGRACPVRARFKILWKQKSGKTKSTMKFVRSNFKKDCTV